MDLMRRRPGPVTAARLADDTGVSPRQLYRDIATLRAGGALIDGEAGLGYTLTEDPALPPQSFSRLEIEALVMAVNGLRSIADAELAAAGEAALARIIATLPEAQGRQAMHVVLRSFYSAPDRPAASIDMSLLRRACWEEFSLRIIYRDLSDCVTTREIWPLALSYSDRTMMLLAHCRLRDDFRLFHVSRIDEAEPGGHSFRPRRVGLVRDYIATHRRQAAPGAVCPRTPEDI